MTTLAAGAGLPEDLASVPGAGDARGGYRKLAVLHPGTPERVLALGLGDPGELDAEKLRVLGAVIAKEARRLEASSIAWAIGELGPVAPADAAAAIAEGVIMGAYRFDRYLTPDADDPPGPGAGEPGPRGRRRRRGARRAAFAPPGSEPRPRTASASSRTCRRTS